MTNGIERPRPMVAIRFILDLPPKYNFKICLPGTFNDGDIIGIVVINETGLLETNTLTNNFEDIRHDFRIDFTHREVDYHGIRLDGSIQCKHYLKGVPQYSEIPSRIKKNIEDNLDKLGEIIGGLY